MDWIQGLIGDLNGIVWGPPMLVLILGTGLFLMIGLRLMPLLRLGYGFRMLWSGRRGQGAGDITPFNALMTSLSATIGTGNIAGVGTAIAIGGPGALFWMWCTALMGMATKYAEAVLAVKYREVDDNGNHVGGPMYYIKNGLGPSWVWLGGAFAVFGALAGFGIGNGVQANSVADVLGSKFQVAHWVTGIVMAILVGLVLVGGVRWIARVAGRLVPFMAFAYVFGGLLILGMNSAEIPAAFSRIVTSAFTPSAELGGFAGATMMLAIRFGVARGIFSNEAGLGSAPIAHASAQTSNPVRQGSVAMLGTFIDTLIICTITGLVIVISGQWEVENPEYLMCVQRGGSIQQTVSSSWGIEQTQNTCKLVSMQETATFDKVQTGASLSAAAFSSELPGIGGHIVTLGLALFTFTTILGWSVYSERCVAYLLGVDAVVPFRILWVLAIPLGATVSLNFIWLLADTLNALMAVPNLIALLLLSPVVFKVTWDYFHS